MTPVNLEQSTIKTFTSLLSDISARCHSLEDHIKKLQNQIGDLTKTVQELRDGNTSAYRSTNVPVTMPPATRTIPAVSEPIDLINLSECQVDTATGSSTGATECTEELTERLRRLQWTTFDLHRQNELLRRMLEIQCTINQNAQQVATKENSKTMEGDNQLQTMQPADSTSKSPEKSAPPRDHSSTLPDTPKEQHEEYVPLSAEEMLAQSFADPKVPWSTTHGSSTDVTHDERGNDPAKRGVPYISYAQAPYPACVTSAGTSSLLSTCRKAIMGASSPDKRWNWHQCNQPRGIYQWQNNTVESQDLNGSNTGQKPHWKP